MAAWGERAVRRAAHTGRELRRRQHRGLSCTSYSSMICTEGITKFYPECCTTKVGTVGEGMILLSMVIFQPIIKTRWIREAMWLKMCSRAACSLGVPRRAKKFCWFGCSRFWFAVISPFPWESAASNRTFVWKLPAWPCHQNVVISSASKCLQNLWNSLFHLWNFVEQIYTKWNFFA